MKSTRVILLAALLLAVAAPQVFAHCQIPCGIYDDAARFAAMYEHVTTIEKSMNEMAKLGKEASPNLNQLVRWVNNKEDHADKISEIAHQYFLAQRIKPAAADDAAGQEKYAHHLELLHHIIVSSMKCKQTADPENAHELHHLIDQLKESYLGK